MIDPLKVLHRECDLVDRIRALLSTIAQTHLTQQDLNTFWQTQDSMEALIEVVETAGPERMSREVKTALESALLILTQREIDEPSLESLLQLDRALQLGGEDLLEQLRRHYRGWVDQLGLALEQSKREFDAVVAKLPAELEEHPIVVGDHLYSLLTINGKMPVPLPDYFEDYAILGRQLLSGYLQDSLRFGSTIGMLPTALSSEEPEKLKQDLYTFLTDAGDPRKLIPTVGRSEQLPGGRSLFGEAEAGKPANGDQSPAFQYLYQFCCRWHPTSPMAFWRVSKPIEQTSKQYYRQSLSVTGMREIANSLNGLHDMANPSQLCDAFESLQTELITAINLTRKRCDNANEFQRDLLTANRAMLIQYLEMGYTLTVWPVLLYLTNLVLVTHGLRILFERSMEKPKEDGLESDENAVEETSEALFPTGDDYSHHSERAVDSQRLMDLRRLRAIKGQEPVTLAIRDAVACDMGLPSASNEDLVSHIQALEIKLNA